MTARASGIAVPSLTKLRPLLFDGRENADDRASGSTSRPRRRGPSASRPSRRSTASSTPSRASGRWRRLSRCYEGTPESARAWLEVAALGYLFARLRAEPA